MKKIYSLFFALTAAMAMNATDYYFAGAVNDWSNNNSSYKFTNQSGVLTLELADLYGEFKITENGNWHPQHGAANKGDGITVGGSYTLVKAADEQAEKGISNASILGLTGTLHYTNVVLTLDVSNPDALVITFVSGETYDTSSLPTDTYVIVGAFNSWSLEDNIATFTVKGGKLTATIADLNGTFKIIKNPADTYWDYQWGSNGQGIEMNTPYILQSGSNPGNLSFANPFACYKNATFTLEIKNGDDILTLISGEYYAIQNDWYMPNEMNEWKIEPAVRFSSVSNKENTYELLLPQLYGEVKVVYGEWAVEFGANQVGDTWAINTPYTMTYPCAGNLSAASVETFTDVTATIVVNYEAYTIQLTLSASGEETALHNLKATYKTHKTIENGRVIIYRGTSRFNISGVEEK